MRKSTVSSFIEIAATLTFVCTMAFFVMLSFGILHSKMHGVPAFSFLESLAFVAAFRLLLTSVRATE